MPTLHAFVTLRCNQEEVPVFSDLQLGVGPDSHVSSSRHILLSATACIPGTQCQCHQDKVGKEWKDPLRQSTAVDVM